MDKTLSCENSNDLSYDLNAKNLESKILEITGNELFRKSHEDIKILFQ